VRGLIVDGRLELGARLPSERDLAISLGVSRNTVTRAYDVLRERGFLDSRQGSGSVTRLPIPTPTGRDAGVLRPQEAASDDVIDLTCAALRAPAGIDEAYQAALEALPRHLAGVGYTTTGLAELREALADRYTARGLPTTPDQILITSGAVTAMILVAGMLASPGQRVLIEDPTFPNTSAALRASGLRLHGAPVDSTGWDVTHWASVIKRGRPGIACLIPDFQNPTGALMSDADRAALSAALGASGTTAIVDETVCEMVLDAPHVPAPFAAHCLSAFSVGSSSKLFWGGLRTGWIRTPGPVPEGLIARRVTGDGGAALLEQLVLTHLLRTDRGALDAERRDSLLDARDATASALTQLVPLAVFERPSGGLSLWVELPGLSAGEVAFRARDHGLLLAAGPRFSVGHGCTSRLRLPFVHGASVMVDAVRRLAHAVEDVESGLNGTIRTPTGSPLVA